MRIAITSQNFRTITGHAGKARRFIIYEVGTGGQVAEKERLDLPLHLAIHSCEEHDPHPLDGSDVLITAGSGEGFVRRMARRGTRVVATSETDPEVAVHAFLAGCLKQPAMGGDTGCDHHHHHAHA
jgi:predicted Fe-Mo cluster-binding NifX family protein